MERIIHAIVHDTVFSRVTRLFNTKAVVFNLLLYLRTFNGDQLHISPLYYCGEKKDRRLIAINLDTCLQFLKHCLNLLLSHVLSCLSHIQKSAVARATVIHIPTVYNPADSLPATVTAVSWRLHGHAA